MFDQLSKKFSTLFVSLIGKKKLTEENISEAVREVRLALLDADVNYSVVSAFIKKVKEKAVGDALLKSISPGEQFIKIVHDELVSLMGKEEPTLQFNGHPSVFLVCGLQGSGKTTSCAKLALYLQKKGKKALVAACDLQRPAAVEQLSKLCEQIKTPCFILEGQKDPVKIAKAAWEEARRTGVDVLIVDTAGRIHLDAHLMEELTLLKDTLHPSEVLFVASAHMGQDAVKIASEFDRAVGMTGSILTMLDGNARAGAAISIIEVTKKPLKFEGIGERVTDFQFFHPESMADRILGKGDVINLVKKAEQEISKEEREELEKKVRKASFTYEDYLKQMAMVKRMGSFKSLLKMLPFASSLGDNLSELESSEGEMKKGEAIVQSMTIAEREERVELIPGRRRRIAQGSGTTIDDVNRFVKSFKQLKKFCKSMPQMNSMSQMKQEKMMKQMMPKEKMIWQ